SSLAQGRGDLMVTRRMATAAAAVREDDETPRAIRHAEQAFEPKRRDGNLALVGSLLGHDASIFGPNRPRCCSFRPLPRCAVQGIDGGTTRPNSRSIRPAYAIVVRSSKYPPMICTPIGKPESVRSIGTVVAGRPRTVAGLAHITWSKYGTCRPSTSSCRARRSSL